MKGVVVAEDIVFKNNILSPASKSGGMGLVLMALLTAQEQA